MFKNRTVKKTRFVNKTRTVSRSRGIYKYAEQVSDLWATINPNADGLILSFLVDKSVIDPNKSIKLNGVPQANNYIIKLYKTNLYILHTEINLTKGATHVIEDWNGNTKKITLPTSDVKIAYMSDIHYNSNPTTSNIMFERIRETSPDYLICGGDWVLDDIGLPDGYHWSRFIRNGMSILSKDRLIPWLLPTVGNHDHIGDGWFGVDSDVTYLHDVFPFENGEPTKGYGVVDLTEDVSVFIMDFCTNTRSGRQKTWFEKEVHNRKSKKNLYISHLQMFPSDRPRNVTQSIINNYFETVYNYFQAGFDGHDHSLSTTKPIINTDEKKTGEGGIRFYGQGGMSEKWYAGSQADSWYMDDVTLRQSHFHLINFNNGELTVTAIDEYGDEIFTHTVNRTTKE